MKCKNCTKEAKFRYRHFIFGEIKKELWYCGECLEKMNTGFKKELKRFKKSMLSTKKILSD